MKKETTQTGKTPEFATPFCMPTSKWQFKEELKDELEELGYKTDRISTWNKFPILISNASDISHWLSNSGDYDCITSKRYYIKGYNPELCLALAAMTKGAEPIVGEYIISVDSSKDIPAFPEKVLSIADGSYQTESNNNLWELGYYRKCTVDELVAFFPPKNHNDFYKGFLASQMAVLFSEKMTDTAVGKEYSEKMIKVLVAIGNEVGRAKSMHPRNFTNQHEAYAVILEEVDELWDEIKKNQKNYDLEAQRKEAVQAGAMLVRLLVELL